MLDKLSILLGSFDRWYEKYRTGGAEALEDKSSAPTRVWTVFLKTCDDQIIALALNALS